MIKNWWKHLLVGIAAGALVRWFLVLFSLEIYYTIFALLAWVAVVLMWEINQYNNSLYRYKYWHYYHWDIICDVLCGYVPFAAILLIGNPLW